MYDTNFKGVSCYPALRQILFLRALFFATYSLLPLYVEGQQAYNERDQEGYLCSNNKTLIECKAYLEYRVRNGDTLQLVSDLFLVSRDQIAEASGFSDGQQLVTNQPLLIPIVSCHCVGGRSQYNVSYVIQEGDTFYLISIGTFEGLTTYQAIERANPADVPTKLQPGNIVTLPIRCACPSSEQISQGVQVLVSYPIQASDTLTSISSEWNLSTSNIVTANELTTNDILQENTTLLLPFTNDPQLTPTTRPPTTQPVPSPSVAPTTSSTPLSTKGSSNTELIVGVACGAAAAVTVALCAIIVMYFRRRKQPIPYDSKHYDLAASYSSQIDSVDLGKLKSDLKKELLSGMSDVIDTDSPLWFNFEELQQATSDFSPAYRIQGSVYRGVVRNKVVAIKKMKGGMSQELKILCKVHHSNLIKLLGLSVSGEDHVYLVYEFAENGSLSDCLHNKYSSSKFSESSSSSPYLRWHMRLQIAMDVASALEYIHDYTNPSFVHKDLKSSNILLDENFRAKVANFGMAKLAADQGAPPMLTKHIAGTQGYMAPEYLAHGLISLKLDVYAYGVVLLELLSGRDAILRDSNGGQLPGKERFLSATIGPILDSDHKMEMLRDWMDPVLQDAYPQECALEVAIIAKSCVDNDQLSRPSMKEITYKLSKMFQISLDWESVSGNMEKTYIGTVIEGR